MERTAGDEAGRTLTVVPPVPEGDGAPGQGEGATPAAPPVEAKPAEVAPRPGEGMIFCATCGKQNVESARFCGGCGATIARPRAQERPAAQRALAPPRDSGLRQRGDMRYAQGKNPTVAALLSLLIVGLGQFYNGDSKKGALMLVGAILLGALTLGFAWLAMVVWSSIDAYKVAKGDVPLWT